MIRSGSSFVPAPDAAFAAPARMRQDAASALSDRLNKSEKFIQGCMVLYSQLYCLSGRGLLFCMAQPFQFGLEGLPVDSVLFALLFLFFGQTRCESRHISVNSAFNQRPPA